MTLNATSPPEYHPSGPGLDEWFAFIDSKFRPEFQIAAKNYVQQLLNNRLPAIFDLTHLGLCVGLDRGALMMMTHNPRAFYRVYEIPKRSGGTRQITAPMPSLLQAQRWILRYILKNRPLADSVHGFRSGRSIVSNGNAHLGARCVLKIDIRDFFPSVRAARVLDVFDRMGYRTELTKDLTSLCTLNNQLPQGAATSPALANIVARNLDLRLEGLASKFSLRYTRYADDLTFSGRLMSLELPAVIAHIVEDEGFVVNEEKTRLMRGSSRKIVTGISVGSGSAHLPRETRRKLKAELYSVLKYGPMSHLERRGIHDPQFIQRLLGRVSFWLQIEPEEPFARRAHRTLSEFLAAP
jgi:RNA-directed DNA polymerase